MDGSSAFARVLFVSVLVLAMARSARASTYVVYIPLDSPIYDELDTLDSLGYTPDYIDEIKPISRIEAARLTIEAQDSLNEAQQPDAIAREIVRNLRDELHEEVALLQANNENNPPTAVLHPLQRAEVQYIYSTGPERYWRGASRKHAERGRGHAFASQQRWDRDGARQQRGRAMECMGRLRRISYRIRRGSGGGSDGA